VNELFISTPSDVCAVSFSSRLLESCVNQLLDSCKCICDLKLTWVARQDCYHSLCASTNNRLLSFGSACCWVHLPCYKIICTCWHWRRSYGGCRGPDPLIFC